MKTLIDGTEVSARSYYYLLDWNEMNEKKLIYELFKKSALNQLTIGEYMQLFNAATLMETESLISKTK